MNIILFDGEPFFNAQDSRFLHIKKILKKTVGDTFKAGIFNGPSGSAEILSMDSEGLRFEFREEFPLKPLYPVHLIIGFPRPIQLKRLLRDVSSLGVSSITLCGTDLGEKSYRESTLVDRGAAMESIREGCVQAGSSAIPELYMTDSVCEALESFSDQFLKIVLDTANPDSTLARAPLVGISFRNPLVLVIGSERGWSAQERSLFRENQSMICSLGSRILRTETAATAALAIALSCAGFMEGIV